MTENNADDMPIEGETVKKVLSAAARGFPSSGDTETYVEYVENFSEYVRDNSIECSKNCMILEYGGDEIISDLLSGLESAILDEKKVEWGEDLLKLVEKIVWEVPNSDTLRRHYKIGNGICHLMRRGLGNNSVDYTLKDRVRAVVKRLVEIGSLNREGASYPHDLDSLSVSINDINGLSFHVLSNYALWCRKNDGKEPLELEVREIFESYLKNPKCHTVSRHAVIGLFFTDFYDKDRDFGQKILKEINQSGKTMAVAFWDAYVNYNKVYRFTFDVLTSWYSEFLRPPPRDNRVLINVCHSTIDHVLLAYLYDLKGADRIFDDFLKRADDDSKVYVELTKHCVLRAGTIIRGKKDNSDFNKERLTNLWKRSCIRQHDLTRWFEVSPLDKKVTIFLYSDYLKQYPGRFYVFPPQIEILCEYVDEYPGQVTDCLDEIIKKSDRINAYNETKDILTCLSRHDDCQIRKRASSILDRLHRNHHEK